MDPSQRKEKIVASIDVKQLYETHEETVYKCNLLAITMKTRCLRSDGIDYSDELREYGNLKEHFCLTMRELGSADLELIWWFVAVIEETNFKQDPRAPEDEHSEA
jgi:hypothetical protein